MSISIRNSEGYLDLTAYHALCRIEREEKGKSRRKYMPKVYIISPFAGDVERNTANARRYCFFAVKQGYIPFAAHLFFPQILNDCNPTERQLGLFMGMVYLDGCREAWVFGERHGGRDCKSRETEYQAQIFYRKLRGGVTAYVPKRAV